MFLMSLDRHREFGLLILRVGIGIMMMLFGYPMLVGGPDMWQKVGGSMANFGITFAPAAWGFLAALAEFGGGVLLILGLAFRVGLIGLIGTMTVALTFHLKNGDDMSKWNPSVILGIVFVALFFIGPGKYAVDSRFGRTSPEGT